MPQGRIILKAISESKKLSNLSCDGARLLYTWLIPHLDVNGCFSGDPEVVRGKVFTRLKKSVEIVEKYLSELESADLVVRYPANGDIFLCVPDFTDKQPHLQPSKEGKPRIPEPTPDQLRSNSHRSKVKQSKVKQSKVKTKDSGVGFDEFWKIYPRKVAKPNALEAWLRINPSNELCKRIYAKVATFKVSEQWIKDDGKYIPHPATWLNQERWADEVETKETAAEKVVRLKAAGLL